MDVILFLFSCVCMCYIPSRLTADHRLRGRDRTFLANYPVKDKDTPDWIFTSVVREEVNTGEVMVESHFNNVGMSASPPLCLSFGICLFKITFTVPVYVSVWDRKGEFENNFVLFIWWFHRRWWGLSPPSAAVCTHTLSPLIFCPLSIHLRPSSLQSICHPRLLSLMTVPALFHHFCLSGMSFFISFGFIWF